MSLPNPRFEDSYERLFASSRSTSGSASADEATTDRFFERFYERFLADPDIARRFGDSDMTRQVRMLKQSFYRLAFFHVSVEPNAELERLASLHVKLGVPAEDLDKWLSALLDTVAEFDSQFDELTRLAWCCALAPGMTYLRILMLEELAAHESSDGEQQR